MWRCGWPLALALVTACSDDGVGKLTVPGDLVAAWRASHFDNRTTAASDRQNKEREFYLPCSRCGRLLTQIKADPPVEACRGRPCGRSLPPITPV